ncbi:MAG TPA: translation initiation factor IF-3 [Candidatus Dormibacteraeota bacterium]|nr:translation initiation factor IF-3 [Candidatus Dormibacteraeota bacterium]
MPSGDPVVTLGTIGRSPAVVSLRRCHFLFFLGGNAIARPLRVNDQIRIRTIRVIDENGEQLGILPTDEALARARAAGLDLIEISPTAQPPVCKIGDFGRLKYEQSKKDKDTRKKQRHFELKEVKLRPKIETHDYETKARMAERLLLDGSKVKVTIMFRGREITYTSFGRRLLDRMAEDMNPLAIVEREPRLEGRNMFMILAPRATPTGPPKFSSTRDHKDHDDHEVHDDLDDDHDEDVDDVDDIDQDDHADHEKIEEQTSA